ncbi:hypothetical protein FRC96_11350 [Lujinxingia vulgaris]|uniref:Uncharacterized protein n=1 Tax=Lujinxingia vulgaris TaxID=2600176 RepID=A0A5C6X6I7_9DELT|nr:DUF6261 family protein [Lujinxingia vulgaris]TXD35268.1 hypothetical protein FRC96_11350 [Lujinxingia vulgaris]
MSAHVQLTDLLNYRQPTAGAMLFALQKQHARLSPQAGQPAEIDNAALKGMVEEAIAVNTKNRSLTFDWRNQRKTAPLQREGIAEVDARADRALSQLARAIANWAELELDHPNRQMARTMQAALFPEGVGVTTSLRYEDQNAAIDELLGRLHSDYSSQIDALGLQIYVTQLTTVNAEYTERLSGLKTNAITYDQVQEAHRVGLEAYFAVILRVWNDYLHDPATRAKLLAPVEEQEQRVRAYYKRRRIAPPIDPETGEVLDEVASDPNAGEPAEPVAEPVADPSPALDTP